MNQDIKLEEIWKVELEILDEIDRVCRENGLRYSLAYGTLLGAVRHKGFIPWDDDIDIMMPREDYDRLRSIWREKAKEGFILEDETMFTDYANNFGKVRKDRTTFLQFETERLSSHHKGIYIDVFPGDRVAPGKLTRRLQYVDFLLNLLYNRGYSSGSGGALEFGEKVLLKLIPKKCHRRLSLYFGKRSRRWNQQASAEYVFPSTFRVCRIYYPDDLFENLERIPFQGRDYSAVRDRDHVLRLVYGDYMQLPPKKERVWRHHPILVDFTRNYDEIPWSEKQ